MWSSKSMGALRMVLAKKAPVSWSAGMRGFVLDSPRRGTYFILDDTNLSALLEKQSH
ncbi:MAG: hypothetical protein R2860_16480 [Desulfobacterales bacterium]